MMRSRYKLLAIVLVALVGGLTAFAGTTGDLDSPGPPDDTYSYSLEDIYNRLDSGVAGAQSAFTEPSSGPTVGTGHTLNEIMAQAPAVDDANGATSADVLASKMSWGLTSSQWGLITGTHPPAPVPKTGQTTPYATGDDGDLQKGVAWPAPRFTDNGDGTVTDNLTGLIWLQNANCFGQVTWAQALSDANTLNSGECGLSDGSVEGDWRLPNVRELHSLVHFGVYDPAVPNTAGTGQWTEGDPFTGIQSPYYWSSTTFANNTAKARRVYMDRGGVGFDYKTYTYYVWPVRGGQ